MKKKSFSEDNYIDIAELLSKIWKKKIFILKSAVFSIILGVIYSLSLTNIYKSSSKFYPHYEEVDNSSGLRSLAGLAGINLNNQAATNIPTNLYPNLIKSINFKKKILNQEVIFNDQIITYRKYLLLNVDKISFNLFNNILQKLYQNNNSVKINKDLIIDLEYINQEDYGLFKTLDNNIELSVNQENGFIELSVFDKNPEISAIIAKKANIILQQNIIDFKIKNINELYNFTTNQLNIAKNNLYKLQDSLANFKDSNRSIKSDIFKNELNRIETELNISKNIYNELALTKEKTAIDVRKNTPIFTIIDQVVVPSERFKPKRSLIVLFFLFIGVVSSITYVLIKDQFKTYLPNKY
tara:strand:+ start:1017 stop:2078 length:1062 start_codon:yes stop_codon:yes gene_type:complete